MDIQDATGSTYPLGPDDEGKTIKVRVSFTDDRDNEEALTSAPTAAVQGEIPVWSADMSVVDLGNGSIGAVRADLFSNVSGSAGLQAKWLWYYTPERKLHLAFTEPVPGVDDLTLQVGDVALALRRAGDSNFFTWSDVDVDWTDGQTLAVRIARFTATVVGTSEDQQQNAPSGNSPATGLPTISGTAQVGETLTASTSDIADEDGLDDATFSYQWVANDGSTDADIQDATDVTYTLVETDEGKTIKVKVSFIDAAGHEETLVSAATGEVAAKPNSPATGAADYQRHGSSR